MSNKAAPMPSPVQIGDQAASLAVRSLWKQWATINPAVADDSQSEERRIVDMEALVLASTALSNEERRFVDLIGWLAGHASGLLSVQRMKTLMDGAPGSEWNPSDFAHWALEWGSDRRWKGFVSTPAASVTPRIGKGPEQPRVSGAAALILRLRAAFGVGVKADLMTYLLCLDGEARSAPEIAEDIGFTDKTVRLSVRDLRLAGLVEEFGDYPVTYATRPGFAARFLALLYDRDMDVPVWCPWPQIYSFLVEVAGWRYDPTLANSSYTASSRARDLFDKYEAAFRSCQLRMPRPESYAGEDYLPVFAEFLDVTESWLTEEV